jgi:excisionase family DNA binding protein
MTVREVAAELNVSKMTISRLIHDRQLHAVRVRRTFRIPRSAYLNYLRRIGQAGPKG